MGDHLIEEGCTCISEIEREKAERTGWLKLYEFPPGEDEDGNPCPIHDPRKKNVSKQENLKSKRGAELRALIVSWDEQIPFNEALAEQAKRIEDGTFAPSPDWGEIADEILGSYLARKRMTAWDKEPEPKDDGPKLVLP
jgi:hypothetical protein